MVEVSSVEHCFAKCYAVHCAQRRKKEKVRSSGLDVHLEEKIFAFLTLWTVLCVILNGYLQRIGITWRIGITRAGLPVLSLCALISRCPNNQ